MENRIIVFSDNLDEIKGILNRLGCFDALIYCNRFEDFLENCRKARECQRAVVICENEQIDKLVDEIKEAEDKFSLVEEQALLMETAAGKILFLPAELDAEKFLSQFLGQEEVFVVTVFGKSRNSVKAVFEELKSEFELNYEIITKTAFLHTVYFSKEVDEERLKEAFGENLLSFSDEGVAGALGRVCNKNLGVCEHFTSGLVTSRLKTEAKAKIAESTLILEDKDTSKYVPESIILENGAVSKEVAFALAKNLAKNCEVALVTLATEGKGFVAVGDTAEIHVFSVCFEKENFLQNFVDFALFRLLKYLS